MDCPSSSRPGGSDTLDLVVGDRHFDSSATAWLIGQGVRYLHMADPEGELAYQRVVELLRGRDDLTDAIAQVAGRSATDDPMLRWSLLHLVGDAGDGRAAEFLARSAAEKLVESDAKGCCESTRDLEVLVRTMAVEALGRLAGRHPEAADLVLKVVAGRPDRAVLIEAVKVAVALRLGDKVRGVLPKDDHWMLDIRKARTEEVQADPERKDGGERGFTPPKLRAQHTAPKFGCCSPTPKG